MRGAKALPFLFLGAFASAGSALSAGACSTFGGEGDPSADGSGLPEATTDDGSVGPESGPVDAGRDRAEVPLPCPLPRAPSCKLLDCEDRTLHEPSGTTFPGPLATDADHLYWLEAAPTEASPARLMRAPKNRPADPKANAQTLVGAQAGASLVALDDAFVYWVTVPEQEASVPVSVVRRVLRACAPPCDAQVETRIALPAGRVTAFVRAAPGVFFVGFDGGDVSRLAATSSGFTLSPVLIQNATYNPQVVVRPPHVYAAGFSSVQIQRVGIDGTGAEPVGPGLPDGGAISALGSDCVDVFVGRNLVTPYPIDRLANGSLPYSTFVTSSTFVADTIAADEGNLYVRNLFTGLYWVDRKSPNDGYKQIVSGPVRGVTVDEDGVYWAEGGAKSGVVHMRVK